MSDEVFADVVPEPKPPEPDPDPEERVWKKAHGAHRERARAEEHFERDHRKVVVCVICGHVAPRRGNKPLLDDNGVAWCLCPRGCRPPDELGVEKATMVPLTGRKDTVFDIWALSPGDFMGPTEGEVADRAAEYSDNQPTTNSPGAVSRLPGAPPDVYDRFGRALGRRWAPAPRVATRQRY